MINWDLPSAWQDYVHRVGRTARNGKRGFAVSFITERDIDVIHTIEEKINIKLTQLEGLENEDKILEKLNTVATAKRVATMALHDGGFGERQQRNKEKQLGGRRPRRGLRRRPSGRRVARLKPEGALHSIVTIVPFFEYVLVSDATITFAHLSDGFEDEHS